MIRASGRTGEASPELGDRHETADHEELAWTVEVCDFSAAELRVLQERHGVLDDVRRLRRLFDGPRQGDVVRQYIRSIVRAAPR